MRYPISILLILAYSYCSATDFIAVASGNWNGSGVWSTDGVTPITCVTCVAGTDYPGSSDDAWTNGFSITINQAYSVRDLMVENVSGSIVFGTNILTVNGAMLGWSGGLGGSPTITSNNVFTGTSRLIFTAQDLSNAGEGNLSSNEVISYWNHSTPIVIAQFNLTQSAYLSTGVSNNNLLFTNQFNLQSGTLTIASSVNQIRVSNNFFLGVNSLLNTSKPLVGASGISSKMNLIQLSSGSQINFTGTNTVLNANTVRLIGTSVLNFSSSGSNFTNGWWYQTLTPNLFDISTSSAIRFNAIGDQVIPAVTYGRLLMAGSGNRTLSTSGTLTVNGDMSIGSSNTFISSFNSNAINIKSNLVNNGTWSATQNVIFSGTSGQTISGSSIITFGGGILISNTSGTVSLSGIGADINGEFNIGSGSIFSPSSQTVNLSANLVVDGTLTASTGTFIFDGVTTISGAGSINFQNIQITGELTSLSGNLSVGGNFIDNGTFNSNGGTVVFSGTSTQSISGSSSTDFENIQISNTSSTVSVSSSKNLIGIITLDDNTSFNAGGNLTLISNASGDATVAAIPSTASFTGNVIYQRYFDDALTGRFRNFGLPVPGNVSDLTAAGLKTTFNPYSYDETEAGLVDYGWNLETSSLLDTKGYTIYMYGDGDVPATVNFTGALNTGDVNLPVTYTDSDATPGDVNDGWNFVNNPYASTIDWGAAGWTKTGVNATCAVWNGLTYDYLTGAPGDYISSGQSFWVQTNSASPVLVATQSVKSNQSKGFLRALPDQDWLKVIVTKDGYSDIAHIKFREDATIDFDTQYDAFKFQNSIHNISSISNAGNNLAVNALPLEDCNPTVKLDLTNVTVGSHQMTFEGLDKLIAGYEIILNDNFLTTSSVITGSTVYSFEVTADVLSYGANRFELEFNSIIVDNTIIPVYNAINECDSEYVSFELSNVQNGLYYQVKNELGNSISTEAVAIDGIAELRVNKSDLNSNNLLSVFVSGRNPCSGEAVFSDIINFNLESIPEIVETHGAVTCPGNTETIIISASGAPLGGSYKWYSSYLGSALIGETNETLELNGINSSTMYYVSAVGVNGCEGEKVPVKVDVQSIQNPEVINGYYCSGKTVTLEASGASTGQQYLWYSDFSDLTPLAITDLGIYETEVIYNSQWYYVSITNNSGCESERIPVYAEVIDVYLTPPTVLSSSVCVGGQIELIASGAEAEMEYRWYENETDQNSIQGESSSIFTTTFLEETTTYFVSVINSIGCESEKTEVNAIIDNLSVPSINVEGTSLSVDVIADNYQWYYNDKPIEGATSYIIDIDSPGTYFVEVNKGECNVRSLDYLHVITGISRSNELKDFVIYPNPVDTRLFINDIKNTLLKAELYDLAGNRIFSNDDLVNYNGIYYFKTLQLKKGMYMLSILTLDDQLITLKVVKN